ncbi:MAG: replication-associated recombination protein A, partial [Actinomycetota bacterium]|nr:replication-associated recombination protein A [Actinomycetota bacterium]
MDLFDQLDEDKIRDAPLAERMRPKNLDEFEGQENLVGVGMPLRVAIEEGNLGSIILWGP